MRQQPDTPIVWLKREVKTPPFSRTARLEAGLLLRSLQQGDVLGLPPSRPMPAIGVHCHALRIPDREQSWRIVYHVAEDAIAILEVFSKKTQSTPPRVIEVCTKRSAAFLKAAAMRERP
ncbi:type II toxin-antitoxin system RelE/ParE family toxin [Paludibaculum fermentans]|uniref:Type II toxin-antitoxin system RelE/ParE family toxin n=1 Tax=Paludibaculum fermentans TaxID=1473598 RepID=A0A7S7NR43_PALFE|nr:type II toxin-antitoxin system RelE/ParE family toxin [Paludibaculum fermentans]QOY88277.1 type II toxin-antitoxin system RelE/ParE family toxin [Paludibaculum fermentans]